MRVKSQASYLQSTHPVGGPSGQAGLEQTEVIRWVRTPDTNTGRGLSLIYSGYIQAETVTWTQISEEYSCRAASSHSFVECEPIFRIIAKQISKNSYLQTLAWKTTSRNAEVNV